MKEKSNSSKIRNVFVTGLIAILPISITFYILLRVLGFMDGILGNTINEIVGFKIPGLGVLLVILLIFVIGLIVNSYFGKRLKHNLEERLKKIPIVSSIFTPVRDIVGTMTEKKSSNFERAVLVHFPNDYTYSMGFITKDKMTVLDEDRLAVFIPTTPNPTNGFLIYLKQEKITEINLTVEEALKTVISVGTISPDIICSKENAK